MEKEQYIQVCPKCFSPNIETDFSNAGAVALGFFQNIKKCNNCGHSGTFFPKISENKIKVKKSSTVKNRQYVNDSFLKGYFAYFFLFGGAFSIIVGVIIMLYKLFAQGFAFVIVGIISLFIYYFSKGNSIK